MFATHTFIRRSTCLALMLSLSACGTSAPTGPDSGTAPGSDGGGADAGTRPDDAGDMPALDAGRPPLDGAGPMVLPATLGPSDRPAQLVTPDAHDGITALPVLVSLHGYGGSGGIQDSYLGLSAEASARGMYVIIPDGLSDTSGRRFWNATPACCDFGPTGVDDVAYITGLLDELESIAPVSDIVFMGHSNGGFMSYRMACELAPRISAIVSLAGGDYVNAMDCEPSQPVSVLQIHGTADATIAFTGAAGGFPSAADTVARWAERAGCDPTSQEGEPIDLDSSLAGDETTVDRYVEGCTGAQAELWTIAGGAHIPTVSTSFTPSMVEWLLAHRRSLTP